jgi:formate hydrogenlyase subunit 3/multisubunit Na+/H+ antiporter MnhD subunit
MKMNGKILLHTIFIRLIFVIIAIVSAVLIAGIVAFIVSNITDNVNTIVTSSLISVWIAEIIIFVLRSRMTYNKRIKLMDTNEEEKINKEKIRLKKWYIISTIIFTVLFGIILHSIYEQTINSINGTEQEITKGTQNISLFIKIIISVVLIIIILIKKTLERRKDKIIKDNAT